MQRSGDGARLARVFGRLFIGLAGIAGGLAAFGNIIRIPNDVNHDGVLSGRDVAALTSVLLGNGPSAGDADCNRDGKVDIADLVTLVKVLRTSPPDPSSVAPAPDLSLASDLLTASQFLTTGPSPLQIGVTTGTLQLEHIAILRGKVSDTHGNALPGVNITIMGHPEFGTTFSRTDGMFDMAVNGGGQLVVNYIKDGCLPIQRHATPPWREYTWLDDAVLLARDTRVTAIDPGLNLAIQVAHGSPVIDADGTRTTTLLFPQGTQAVAVKSDGTTQSLGTLHVRATEYTVGKPGLAAMPAELPPSSAFTYCVNLSVDEADAIDARGVTFNQPVVHYVENFLNFPVGSPVPVGYYDHVKGQWVPSDNGRVIEILSITSGTAVIDVNGSHLAATANELAALGITDSERLTLGARYQAGQSLWRVALMHFSDVDCNWPYGPSANAKPPKVEPPDDPLHPRPVRKSDPIEPQNQSMTKDVRLVGTLMNLHYQSDRVEGRLDKSSLLIPLSDASLPQDLKRIEMEMQIAGRRFKQTFSALANQSYEFVFDRMDAYGRKVQGPQPYNLTLGYVYDAVYQSPYAFGRAFGALSGNITANAARREVTLLQRMSGKLGSLDAKHTLALGGWSLSPHHVYDPDEKAIYLGTGERRGAATLAAGQVINTVAGSGGIGGGGGGYAGDNGPGTQALLKSPAHIAAGPDGSIYIADQGNHRIRRLWPGGTITTVAGNGSSGGDGDGELAINAQIDTPQGVAVAPDGGFYIADYGNGKIRYVAPSGVISTFAGSGTAQDFGDGGPATEARIAFPRDVALAPDGSVYAAEANKIRKIGTDGIISTVVSGLNGATGLAVDPDGGIYIVEGPNYYIRKLGPDGVLTTVAGRGTTPGEPGDGIPATLARVFDPYGIAVAPDGTFYISEYFGSRVRMVRTSGIISTFAGVQAVVDYSGDNQGFSGDMGPATRAKLYVPEGVAVSPDGNVYISDTENHRIRCVSSALPGVSVTDIVLASEDGGELYVFSGQGRHKRTLDALTGIVHYEFGYDSAGRLISMTDENGLVTSVLRDGLGNPTKIVSPGGQQTTLTVNGDGYLASIANPAGDTIQLTYTSDGLMTGYTNARHNAFASTYDAIGRIVTEQAPDGGITSLTATRAPGLDVTTLTLPTGRRLGYRVEKLANGDEYRTYTGAGGVSTHLIATDGTQTIHHSDGGVVQLTEGPDPRFGMQSPVLKSLLITSPAGLASSMTTNHTLTLSDSTNPLSVVSFTDTVNLNGHVFTRAYNAATRTNTITSPLGRTSTATFDALGRMITQQITGFPAINYSYNSRGLLTQVAQSVRTISYAYDAQDRLSQLTDPLGRSVGFTYDGANRVTKFTLSGGREISFAYDANGNPISVLPPGKTPHLSLYNSMDLLSESRPPANGDPVTSSTYGFNLEQLLTSISRPDGVVETIAYDSAARLSSINTPDGAIAHTYDPSTGNLTSITTPGGSALNLTYDGSLLMGSAWSGPVSGTVGRTYDHDFRISSLSVNGGTTVTYQYDADGLMTQEGALGLARVAANGLIQQAVLGTITTNNTYSAFGEPTASVSNYNATGLLSNQYVMDAMGRITQNVEDTGGQSHTYVYTYDLGGRLILVTKDAGIIETYTYDFNGNRVGGTNSLGTASGVYDAQDRLLQYGATTCSYGANGDLRHATTGGQTTDYAYDSRGNLRTVVFPSTSRIDYIVDGKNRRIGKKVDGTLVQGFLYQDQYHPIAELDGTNAVVARFVYGLRGNAPDYMIKGGVTYRILADQLGSPRLVVDTATGNVAQRMNYDAFGNVILDTQPGFQPFGFAGGILDRDTGLTRFGARDYDAATGRWVARDPSRFGGGDPNLYCYCGNDPINSIDPGGLREAEASALWSSGSTPDYAAVSFGIVSPWFIGGNLNLTLGRHGLLVFTPSVQVGVPGIGGSIVVGKCSGGEAASTLSAEEDILTGVSISGGGGCVLGGGFTYSPTAKNVGEPGLFSQIPGRGSIETGLYPRTPGASVGVGYGWLLNPGVLNQPPPSTIPDAHSQMNGIAPTYNGPGPFR